MGEPPKEDGSYPVLRTWWGWRGSQGKLHRKGDLRAGFSGGEKLGRWRREKGHPRPKE